MKDLQLEVKLKLGLLIQMYKIIFLFHIKYKKIKIRNCSGFEPSPIKIRQVSPLFSPLSHFTCVTMVERIM